MITPPLSYTKNVGCYFVRHIILGVSFKIYFLAFDDFNRQGSSFDVSPQQDHIYPLRLQYLIPIRVHMQSSSCHLYVPVCLLICDTISSLRGSFLNEPIELVFAYAFH